MTAHFRAENKTADERDAEYRGNGIVARFRPQETYPFTHFRIERADGASFEEKLHYSHHTLARLLTCFQFNEVLEIGSRNGTAARAMEFVGKQVETIEILQAFQAKYVGDYLDIELDQPVDAIWCSHVLEHQRHLGRFLEKMYDDLKVGGVLAVTVPSALHPLLMGHCNIFTPLHLLYNLVLAGFDCAEASIKQYDWQFGIIVKKKPNDIPRISFATTHLDGGDNSIGYHSQILNCFPPSIARQFDPGGIVWGEVESINW